MNTTQQPGRKSWFQCAIGLLVLGGALTACRENALDGLTPTDSPVYITNYDRSVNFNQYKTFSLPDSVVVESNDQYATSLTSTENQFVTAVANALTAKGFQRVARGASADLGVAVIRVNNRYTGVGVNPYGSYYSSYWGGFGGLGGYGYAPYYPTYYTYQVSDRYWEIQMVDLKNRPAQTGTDPAQLNVIYDATARATDITDQAGVDATVNAIFSQSTYLQASR